MSEIPLYPSFADLFPIPLPFYGVAIVISGLVSLIIVIQFTPLQAIWFERLVVKAQLARGRQPERARLAREFVLQAIGAFVVAYPVTAWLLRAFAGPLFL